MQVIIYLPDKNCSW